MFPKARMVVSGEHFVDFENIKCESKGLSIGEVGFRGRRHFYWENYRQTNFEPVIATVTDITSELNVQSFFKPQTLLRLIKSEGWRRC